MISIYFMQTFHSIFSLQHLHCITIINIRAFHIKFGSICDMFNVSVFTNFYFQNTVDYFADSDHDGTLWIEKVESMLYRPYVFMKQ